MLLGVERPFVGAFAPGGPGAELLHRNGLVRAVLPASARTRANGQWGGVTIAGHPSVSVLSLLETSSLTAIDPALLSHEMAVAELAWLEKCGAALNRRSIAGKRTYTDTLRIVMLRACGFRAFRESRPTISFRLVAAYNDED